MAQSDKERQQARRDRMIASGSILLREWIHPDDKAQIKAYITRLNRRRARETKRSAR